MELSTKIVSCFKALNISIKNSASDVWQCFEYSFDLARKYFVAVETKDIANYTKTVSNNNKTKITCQSPKNNEKNGTSSIDIFSDFQYNLVIYNNKLLLIVESANSLFLILFLVTLWDTFAQRLPRWNQRNILGCSLVFCLIRKIFNGKIHIQSNDK